MLLTAERKKDLFKKHGKTEKNTGSAEAQIAMFSERINHLTEPLKVKNKDFSTQRALIKLVGQRRSLLDYLQKNDINRYRSIISELGIRK
jgi:small subunit ribosomal protein S15